ncbi:hypothetical protein EBR61_02805, partial [bacterium]|nr:hypothetical protein [bacterium]
QAKKDAVNDIPFYALDDQMYLFIGRVSAWNSRDTPDGSIDPNPSSKNRGLGEATKNNCKGTGTFSATVPQQRFVDSPN